MRKYPTDYRLWGLISGCLFAPIAFGWLMFEGIQATARVVNRDVVALVFACAVVGWVLHAVAVVCGVRLSGKTDPPEAADYDDDPPPPPAG